MGSLKKFDGSSWINSNLRKLTTDTDTFTTFPAIIYAEGTNATIGLKGNTVQSSTPTPDSPVMPQGTGERTGNLYNINAKDVNNGYVNNAQLSQDGTNAPWGNAEISEYIPISGDTAYTFNGIGSYNSPCYGLYDENKQLIGAYRYSGAQIIKFTSPNNARYFRFTHIKTATRAMMVEGAYTTSTMPDYEPYGIKIPISSANTTTPVYLGEVETTRRIKKLVLDGTENWFLSTTQAGRFGLSLSDYLKSNETITSFCSHYMAIAQKSGGTVPNNSQYFYSGSDAAKYLFIVDTNCSTAADFKSFLQQQFAAGTPVTVWYVLATEETAVVNEPLMKIGDYSDTVSGISIPVTAGGDTLSVGTTVQPSEVTANYYGWHTITVHERVSGQWD